MKLTPVTSRNVSAGIDGAHASARSRGSTRLALVALSLALFLPLPASAEKLEQLEPQGYVNDFAHVFDRAAAEQINALCAEVDQKTGAQIAVVTINSLEGAPVEDFASRLFARWGIGSKKDNRGVLVLLAKADHQYRIEVGYGLEPILPDGKVGGFGREMVPRLRSADYSGALLQLTSQIASVIASDRGVTLRNQPRVSQPEKVYAVDPSRVLWLIVLAVIGSGLIRFLISPTIRSGRRYRGAGWWGGPGIGGWGGGGFGGGGGGGGFGGFGGGMSGGGGASGGW